MQLQRYFNIFDKRDNNVYVKVIDIDNKTDQITYFVTNSIIIRKQ